MANTVPVLPPVMLQACVPTGKLLGTSGMPTLVLSAASSGIVKVIVGSDGAGLTVTAISCVTLDGLSVRIGRIGGGYRYRRICPPPLR